MTDGATAIDFAYPWWLSHGHLAIFAFALLGLLVGYRRRWPTWLMAGLLTLSCWSAAAFFVVRSTLDLSGTAALPTANFLRSGDGRVLDLGAGTGRSSIMVLQARPRAALVALDLFGDSFELHFGPSDDPRRRLLANLKAAGVDQRAAIETGDVRNLPFENATFEAAVCSYVIDHLGREGAQQALAEAARVIKPGGDFLMTISADDAWTRFAFGPMLIHSARSAEWWSARIEEAGFDVVEVGTPPMTLYILARRR